MALLEIKNLQVEAEGLPAAQAGKLILRGLSLTLDTGSVLALMGPNGSGKSTLAHVLMGHPGYKVAGGSVTYDGQDLLALKPEARAKAGLFLSFQYPQTIAGVNVGNFLRLAYNSTHDEKIGVKDFVAKMQKAMDVLSIPHAFMLRAVNEGMSGGEKKRLEMLQLLVLQPRLAMLDETDSRLDIDALKIVAGAAQALRIERPDFTLLVITHYQRLLTYLPADRVAIMKDGVISAEGGPEIIQAIERDGYKGIVNE